MKIIEIEDTVSTNQEAKQYIADNGQTPAWISAKTQSGGRGRGGKSWVSMPGNLYASGIYAAFPNETLNAQCSFAAALAVFETVKILAPFCDVKIKWPNDVLVDGAKISGILLERANRQQAEFLIVGIGINIASNPKLDDKTTTCLANLGVNTTAGDVLETLIKRFDSWRETLGNFGFPPLQAAWSERAYNLGKPVQAKIDNQVIFGIAKRLDENGTLRIQTQDGREVKISAGDVFFL